MYSSSSTTNFAMARVDASFGPAITLGFQLERLPSLSNARMTYSDGTEIDVEAYTQVSPGVSGASTAPFTSGEWIPLEVTYTGSFAYKTVKRGRKRYKQLSGGTVYSTESWYGDEYWVDMSGFAISLSEAQAASTSTAAMFAYEKRLMAGADIISGSDYKDMINGLTGNDNIDGRGGDDVIYGGDGDDVIKGGTGMNVLRGDGGRDRFVLTYGDGHDTIYGYEPGIDSLDASALYSGITTRQDGSNLWIYSGSDTVAVLMSVSSI